MRNLLFLIMLLILLPLGYITYLNKRPVKVLATYESYSVLDILVNDLPYSTEKKIQWWHNNKSIILKKKNIKEAYDGGPKYYVFFEFDGEYKEEGKEDRLCFDEVPPPKNCIDKKRLMSASLNINKQWIYSIGDKSYKLNSNGKITENSKE